MPTGAEALVATLAGCGVDACFANPGTSEMHLVAALDREPRIRSILCLFEGVATGAADGYARVVGKPAMTLLHLGSGLSNGGANLHNARRAYSPIVNVVGDHATSHLRYDAPLTSDIATLARPLSIWSKSVPTPFQAGPFAAEAWRGALSGPQGPSILILPADCAWEQGGVAVAAGPRPQKPAPPPELVDAAARAVRAAKRPMLVVNGSALLAEGLGACARLEAAGVRVLAVTFPARQSRGAGRFAPARMQYFSEAATADLAEADLLVLAGAREPAGFFAYPGRPSLFAPGGCAYAAIATEEMDTAAALAMLADALDAKASALAPTLDLPAAPKGALDASAIAASIARHMPEGALVSEEAITSGFPAFALTQRARPHEWMVGTGGAIGQALPVAVGAAVAAPDRKVLCLSGDGSAMYTIQALWTMARENLDVLLVIFANRTYRILNVEFARTGAGEQGAAARAMLSIDNPVIDFVALARAQGVEAVRCDTAESFEAAFEGLIGRRGPALIEAVI